MTDKVLVVLLAGERIGEVVQRRTGRFRFTYDDEYRERPSSTPLSLSMPLTAAEHDHRVVDAFLWGVLPDSLEVLRRWGRDYRVSDRNPFALLEHVGEDCAGAVQFVRPERLPALAGPEPVEWLTRAEVGARLRTLRADPTAWHVSATSGQFSLAGAQAKLALFHDGDHWGAPKGRTPTTHILKPGVTQFDDHDLNEHLCLELARRLSLLAARSWVEDFDGERAIVVERYDRVQQGGSWARIHQEDMCQALGVPPDRKYQADGGPSPEQIVALLRDVQAPAEAERSVGALLDALALNWLIAGTDAHAKNYSVLLAGPQVRLAPLYDVASGLPYDELYLPKLSLAMKVDGEYRLGVIAGRHWERLAENLDVEVDRLKTRIRELADQLPDALADICRAPAIADLASDLPGRLMDRTSAWTRRCVNALSG